MDIPKGFDEIIKMVMKEPVQKANGQDIWDRFIQAALIGGGRSEADINVLVSWIKKEGLLKLDKVNK